LRKEWIAIIAKELTAHCQKLSIQLFFSC